MLTRKLLMIYIILILIVSPVLTITVFSQDESCPVWNKAWSYRQKIILPISTAESFSIYQPIDIKITFDILAFEKYFTIYETSEIALKELMTSLSKDDTSEKYTL